MSNELIFIITTVGIFGFVLYCFLRGRRWLHAAIVINLIMISVFGAKLVNIFGGVTNVGNIFYVAVFFAGQLLVEHYGIKEGKRSVWLGFFSVLFFVIVGQLTVLYTGIPESDSASRSIETLFKFTPHLALASLLAYLFSQSLNIRLYAYLKGKNWSTLWRRSLMSNIAGQFLDSVIFFSVAFIGSVTGGILFSAILTGFLVKIIIYNCLCRKS